MSLCFLKQTKWVMPHKGRGEQEHAVDKELEERGLGGCVVAHILTPHPVSESDGNDAVMTAYRHRYLSTIDGRSSSAAQLPGYFHDATWIAPFTWNSLSISPWNHLNNNPVHDMQQPAVLVCPQSIGISPLMAASERVERERKVTVTLYSPANQFKSCIFQWRTCRRGTWPLAAVECEHGWSLYTWYEHGRGIECVLGFREYPSCCRKARSKTRFAWTQTWSPSAWNRGMSIRTHAYMLTSLRFCGENKGCKMCVDDKTDPIDDLH